MVTKEKILEVANKGNWFYFHGENRCEGCDECDEYQFTGKHKDDCPLGVLLLLIEKEVPE